MKIKELIKEGFLGVDQNSASIQAEHPDWKRYRVEYYAGHKTKPGVKTVWAPNEEAIHKEFGNLFGRVWNITELPINEGWKGALAGAALATGLTASPASDAVVVLNPARPINAQGGTVADPYKKTQSVTKKKEKIDAMTKAAPVIKPPKKINESLNNLISIWIKYNTEGKKVDKLYVFQNEIGGYSYTIEYMGGAKRGQSKVMHMSYDELKAKLEENGWHLQED